MSSPTKMQFVAHWQGREVEISIERCNSDCSGSGWRIALDDEHYEVDVERIGPHHLSLLANSGNQRETLVRVLKEGHYQVHCGKTEISLELLEPLAHLAQKGLRGGAAQQGQTVTAYMPGRVVKVLVEEGQQVEAGQGLLVLEAMKMENEIQAECAGEVRQIKVAAGQNVDGGAVLCEIG